MKPFCPESLTFFGLDFTSCPKPIFMRKGSLRFTPTHCDLCKIWSRVINCGLRKKKRKQKSLGKTQGKAATSKPPTQSMSLFPVSLYAEAPNS